MQDFTLRFESPELKFGVLGNAVPLEVEVEGWRLRETYVPDAHNDIEKGLGSYRLIVERKLTQADDAQHWHYTGVDLIERIELLWAFAAGLPLRSRGFGVELATIKPPPGWESNVEDVDCAIQIAAGNRFIYSSFNFQSRHWRYAPAFPLAGLVIALKAYGALSDEVVRELIDVHYAAHMFRSSRGQKVFFAKALEIVRKLLPGDTDDERERALSVEVRKSLSRPLHDLYDLSNNRRETRHAVMQKSTAAALHPEMSTQESLAFVRDADLVIRAVVCDKLGLDIVLFKES